MFAKTKKETFAYLFLTIANIFFQFVPLLSNFSYEFAAVNSIILFFLAPVVFYPSAENFSFYEYFKKSFPRIVILSTIPLAISLLSGNAFKCSFLHGLAFFATIPFFTIIYMLFFTFSLGRRKPTTFFLAFSIIFVLFILQPLWEIYFFPHIYFYNALVGYFPGTVYDRYIPIDYKLLSYRFLLLFPFIFAVILRRKKHITLIIAFILIIFLLPVKIVTGFSLPTYKFTDKSSMQIITKEFGIYLFGEKLSENEKKYILLEHKFYKNQIENFLNDKFNFNVKSYIFAGENIKRELFGAPNADVSKPWQKSIFTLLNSGTLKHELAHVYSSKYSDNILKLAGNLNPALIEGFAVAAENNFYGADLYQVAAALIGKDKYLAPVNFFQNYTFFANAPALSYLFAGAFVKYLIDKFGINKFRYYYRTNDFQTSYGKSLKEVSNEFYVFLKKIRINEETQVIVDYVLNSRPIYSQQCPHYLSQLSSGTENFSEKEKLVLYKKIFDRYHAPEFFFKTLDLLVKLRRFDEVDSLFKTNWEQFVNSPYKLKLWNIKITLLLSRGQLSEAKILNDTLIKTSPFLYYKLIGEANEFLINNYSTLGEKYLISNSNDEIKKILTDFTHKNRNIAPALLIINQKLFTPDEIFALANNTQNCSTVTNYYFAKYFLHKLQLTRANKFARELRKTAEENHNYFIKELLAEIDFFKKHLLEF